MVSTSVANAFGKKADLVRIAWYLICAVQLCLSISAIYAASLDNSGMKDVSVAAIWSTILLFGNSILGFLYFVRPVASEKRENPLMFGFWLGFQAMLSPTFLILACFFFSFSELYTEDDDVHSAGGALGSFFLILSIFLSGFWILVLSLKNERAQKRAARSAESGSTRRELKRRMRVQQLAKENGDCVDQSTISIKSAAAAATSSSESQSFDETANVGLHAHPDQHSRPLQQPRQTERHLQSNKSTSHGRMSQSQGAAWWR
mmetsp:Transcript_43720/g.86218  ORF Transcript_43720/g.86218 Transcript_43720/m.86218 type:complete len:261 (-) Transcript_43720:121-903(-)